MTDPQGSTPFPGFAGFKPADMLDKVWEMIRLSPFGGMAAFPGAAHGLPPSLSSMSDMMAPLTSVEELDKRITDLRAVEQWLKLNLGMLQSAIQALEVQRATLATLRAFGAFAQSSMSAAEEAVAAAQAATAPHGDAPKVGPQAAAEPGEVPPPEGEAASSNAAFDPSGWWNLLQTQFNQLASLAVAQPGAQSAAPAEAAPEAAAAPAAESAAEPAADKPAQARKPAAKRPKPVSAAVRAAAASTPASRPPKRGA